MSGQQLKKVELQTPVTPSALAQLEIGNVVYLSGVIYTGREGAYKRILDDRVPAPDGLSSLTNVNFHCSPAASVAIRSTSWRIAPTAPQ